MIRAFFLFLLLPAMGQEESSGELLSKIRESLRRVGSIYSEFEQERKLDLFEEPLRSEGVMVFSQPNRIRWETCKPYRSILVSDGASVAQFEWQEDRWKKLQTGFPGAFKKILDKVAAVCQGRVEELEREYEPSASKTKDGVVMTLVPREEEQRKAISAIELKLHPDLSGAREILLKEPNGDYTRISFRSERRNPSLPEKTFDVSEPVDLKFLKESVYGGAKGK